MASPAVTVSRVQLPTHYSWRVCLTLPGVVWCGKVHSTVVYCSVLYYSAILCCQLYCIVQCTVCIVPKRCLLTIINSLFLSQSVSL